MSITASCPHGLYQGAHLDIGGIVAIHDISGADGEASLTADHVKVRAASVWAHVSVTVCPYGRYQGVHLDNAVLYLGDARLCTDGEEKQKPEAANYMKNY